MLSLYERELVSLTFRWAYGGSLDCKKASTQASTQVKTFIDLLLLLS